MRWLGGHSAHFLFRSDEGRIGAALWLRGCAVLAALFLVFSGVWQALSPYAHRSLAQRAFVDPLTIGVYLYLFAYAIATLLIGVSYVNLSIKRLRAAGQPTAIAGLLPLAALIAGAAHWLHPRVSDVFPIWIAYVADAALFAVAIASFALMARRGDADTE